MLADQMAVSSAGLMVAVTVGLRAVSSAVSSAG